MKKYLIIILAILIVSCEPNPAKEGINLPAMEFGLNVSPDSAYIKIGDTVILSGSISSTLSNGVKIEEGKAEIDLFMAMHQKRQLQHFHLKQLYLMSTF